MPSTRKTSFCLSFFIPKYPLLAAETVQPTDNFVVNFPFITFRQIVEGGRGINFRIFCFFNKIGKKAAVIAALSGKRNHDSPAEIRLFQIKNSGVAIVYHQTGAPTNTTS